MGKHPDKLSTSPGNRMRNLRRFFARLIVSSEELEAEQLHQESQDLGSTPVVSCADREQVRVSGILRAVTLPPRTGVPALEAELYDGTGSLTIIWLGRRQIRGIEPGRQLVVHGRVARNQGRPVMFNPRYELRPLGGRS